MASLLFIKCLTGPTPAEEGVCLCVCVYMCVCMYLHVCVSVFICMCVCMIMFVYNDYCINRVLLFVDEADAFLRKRSTVSKHFSLR